MILRPRAVRAEVRHPLLAPFFALGPLTGLLLAFGLAPYAHGAAQVLFVVFLTATLLFGGWLTGQAPAERRLPIEGEGPGHLEEVVRHLPNGMIWVEGFPA